MWVVVIKIIIYYSNYFLSLNAMNLGLSRRMSEKSEVYLKIKTEYEAK